MNECKATMHIGKRYSIKHNLRTLDREKSNLDGHINYSRTYLNKVFENKNLSEVFDDTFGNALIEYNHQNWIKHPDRVIGYSKKEYDNLVNLKGKETADKIEREKSVNEYLKQQRKNIQEVVIQLGDHETYLRLVEQLGQETADKFYASALEKQFCIWQKRNKSLSIFNAVSHLDEIGDGTPHLHITFIPIAESNRGLSVKVSVDGAMKTLGFDRKKSDTYANRPYIKWLNSNRQLNEQDFQRIADDLLPDNAKLKIIPSEPTPKGHPHVQPEVYKARKAIAAAKEKVAKLEIPVQPPVPQKPDKVKPVEKNKNEYINNHIKEYDLSSFEAVKTSKIRKKLGEEYDERTEEWQAYEHGLETFEKWEKSTETTRALKANLQEVAEEKRTIEADKKAIENNERIKMSSNEIRLIKEVSSLKKEIEILKADRDNDIIKAQEPLRELIKALLEFCKKIILSEGKSVWQMFVDQTSSQHKRIIDDIDRN